MMAHIIGGGPAGLVEAIWLTKLGWEVHLYEMRPEPFLDMAPDPRGFAFTLNHRGLYALPEGLRKAVMEISFPIKRRLFVDRKGRHWSFEYGPRPQDKLYAISRSEFLVECLKAAKVHGVNLHFNCHVEGFDAIKGSVTYRYCGQESTVQGDLVICADGCRSMTREKVVTQAGGRSVMNGDVVSYVAMTLDEKETAALLVDRIGLHFYNSPGAGTDILIPTGGNGTLLVISALLPRSKVSRCDAHEIASTRNPRVLAAIPDFARKLDGLIVGHFSTVSVTNPVAFRAVLIGDAHSTIPAYTGQGVNASLHDAYSLYQSIKKYESLDVALKRYADSRRPERGQLTKMNKITGDLLREGKFGGLRWRIKERVNSFLGFQSFYQRASFNLDQDQ